MENPMFLNFQEEWVYAMEPQEVTSTKDICTHLALGMCSCTTGSSSTSKKRQLYDDDDHHCSKKTARKSGTTEKRWGFSLELMLYDDPWKIKKVLMNSDLGNMSRLLLAKELAENLVLPVLGADAQREVESANGTNISIWDVDTNTMHTLVFKRWNSSGSYVFTGKWVQDFVKRRCLKKGDEIGLHWDPSNNNLFNFSVLHKHSI